MIKKWHLSRKRQIHILGPYSAQRTSLKKCRMTPARSPLRGIMERQKSPASCTCQWNLKSEIFWIFCRVFVLARNIQHFLVFDDRASAQWPISVPKVIVCTMSAPSHFHSLSSLKTPSNIATIDNNAHLFSLLAASFHHFASYARFNHLDLDSCPATLLCHNCGGLKCFTCVFKKICELHQSEICRVIMIIIGNGWTNQA